MSRLLKSQNSGALAVPKGIGKEPIITLENVDHGL